MLTKVRLKEYAHVRFKEKIELKKGKLLHEKLQEAKNEHMIFVNACQNGRRENVRHVLKLAYIDCIEYKNRTPSWLNSFFCAREVYPKYKNLINTNHSISAFKDNKSFINNYNARLNSQNQNPLSKSVSETVKTQKFKEPVVSKKQSQLNNKNLTKGILQTTDHDINQLRFLKSQYDQQLKHVVKITLPSLEVTYSPNLFGDPIVRSRRENLIEKQLWKIRNLFDKYQPIAASDLHHLESTTIDLSSSHSSLASGYKNFVIESFTISEEGEIKLSNLNKTPNLSSFELFKTYSKIIKH
ncbi:unnamed protein product [[Candida] boidinii]|uniref:Unnamed protein product n=1 Tax=Candida boidinii TaxID=5477 RepID=A0ACB5TSH1_CANBO|nr:unnamed protein product [[Candida] boidinii]